MTWDSSAAKALFAVDRWSEGLVDINENGDVIVRPHGDDRIRIPLHEVVARARNSGLDLPLLVRFTDILRTRVQRLERAFADARQEHDYQGDYGVIYPIKVNQRRSVIEEILAGSDRVGLEAGSKPELLAVLALSRPGGRVICNGYKDAAYIRMALIGLRLGLAVTLVIEKASELDLVLRIAEELDIAPRLGIRLRLASIGHGKWQNTGGDKAKFGLSPRQLLDACDRLAAANRLDCLHLLHFHMGSQISNLRDIHAGANEAGRYYAELMARGVRIDTLDVGGGLAVDYEGAASRGYFSMNYGVSQYAAAIVRGILDVCDDCQLPHPTLLSESGRALTAHHAVLITEVLAVEDGVSCPVDASGGGREDHPLLRAVEHLRESLDARPPAEIYQEACYLSAESKEKFLAGQLGLEQRALIDDQVNQILVATRARLRLSRRADRNAEDELRKTLAHKFFCNLSIFRSLPDVWAIDQVFPILPIQGLDHPPDQRAVLEDLTCDSDGRIDYYVEADGLEPTLPVHRFDPATPYLLAIFMVGAYQEILGDNHNLFGRTHSADVSVNSAGDFWIHHKLRGESATQVLADVGFDRDFLSGHLRTKIGAAENLPSVQGELLLETMAQALDGYTYLAAVAPGSST